MGKNRYDNTKVDCTKQAAGYSFICHFWDEESKYP